jgi:hypothetical protein
MLTFEAFTNDLLRQLGGEFTAVQRETNSNFVDFDYKGRTARVEASSSTEFWLRLTGAPSEFDTKFKPLESMVGPVAEQIQVYFRGRERPVNPDSSQRWKKWTNDVFADLDDAFGVKSSSGAERRYGKFTVMYDPTHEGGCYWLAALPGSTHSVFPSIHVAWRLANPHDVAKQIISGIEAAKNQWQYKILSGDD